MGKYMAGEPNLQMQRWYANANVRDKLQRFIHIFARPTEKQICSKNLVDVQNQHYGEIEAISLKCQKTCFPHIVSNTPAT